MESIRHFMSGIRDWIRIRWRVIFLLIIIISIITGFILIAIICSIVILLIFRTKPKIIRQSRPLLDSEIRLINLWINVDRKFLTKDMEVKVSELIKLYDKYNEMIKGKSDEMKKGKSDEMKKGKSYEEIDELFNTDDTFKKDINSILNILDTLTQERYNEIIREKRTEEPLTDEELELLNNWLNVYKEIPATILNQYLTPVEYDSGFQLKSQKNKYENNPNNIKLIKSIRDTLRILSFDRYEDIVDKSEAAIDTKQNPMVLEILEKLSETIGILKEKINFLKEEGKATRDMIELEKWAIGIQTEINSLGDNDPIDVENFIETFREIQSYIDELKKI